MTAGALRERGVHRMRLIGRPGVSILPEKCFRTLTSTIFDRFVITNIVIRSSIIC